MLRPSHRSRDMVRIRGNFSLRFPSMTHPLHFPRLSNVVAMVFDASDLTAGAFQAAPSFLRRRFCVRWPSPCPPNQGLPSNSACSRATPSAVRPWTTLITVFSASIPAKTRPNSGARARTTPVPPGHFAVPRLSLASENVRLVCGCFDQALHHRLRPLQSLSRERQNERLPNIDALIDTNAFRLLDCLERVMGYHFRDDNPYKLLLLAPNLDDWLPQEHMARSFPIRLLRGDSAQSQDYPGGHRRRCLQVAGGQRPPRLSDHRRVPSQAP